MTQARSQQKNPQRAANKRQNQPLRVLLVLGLLATVSIVIAILVYNRTEQEQNATVLANNLTSLIREDSPTRGPADAPVTLVEFLDPECESCRAAYPVVEQILEDYDGQIRYVVRYIPNHNNSALAIAATEAAGEQGKYWEMQELLFAMQPEWGEQSTAQTDKFIAYAETLGLDTEQFSAGLQNPAYFEKAQRDNTDAATLGLRGTPTFFVNGQLVYGLDEQSIRAIIEEAL